MYTRTRIIPAIVRIVPEMTIANKKYIRYRTSPAIAAVINFVIIHYSLHYYDDNTIGYRPYLNPPYNPMFNYVFHFLFLLFCIRGAHL